MTEEQKRKRFEDALERQSRLKKDLDLECLNLIASIIVLLAILALPFFHYYF